MPPTRLCFVCLGNICRSPTAEAVMKKLVADAGLAERFIIESAGTAGYHAGEPADARSRAHGAKRGYLLDTPAAQFRASDFARFDLVLAADASNRARLASLAPGDADRAKIHLLRDFDPASPKGSDVPDPYYGGASGFDDVIDLCERACRGLLASLVRT